jgi:hypothetical protein
MATGSLILMNLALGGLGLLVENAGEWAFHRYVLHGLGRRPGSFWHYHWREHHRAARANGMVDPCYRGWPSRWDTHGKEVLFLLLVAAAHAPLLDVLPSYVAGLYAGLALYYFRHRRSHRDPDWARAHLPWHYEHHMGGDPEANWCIAWPWLDWLAGTRKISGRD